MGKEGANWIFESLVERILELHCDPGQTKCTVSLPDDPSVTYTKLAELSSSRKNSGNTASR